MCGSQRRSTNHEGISGTFQEPMEVCISTFKEINYSKPAADVLLNPQDAMKKTERERNQESEREGQRDCRKKARRGIKTRNK